MKTDLTDDQLIAKFMGYELTFTHDYMEVVTERAVNYEGYFNEWNNLMLVVEKINSTDNPIYTDERIDVIIYRTTCHINDNAEIIIEATGKDMLECTYKAVVGFIKWYNQNKP